MGIDVRRALIRTLKRRDWKYAKEVEGIWLRKDEYFLFADREEWRLHRKTGEKLITVKVGKYGRRQSQNIMRALDSDRKVRRRCPALALDSKVDRLN
jgi:hypothetical protein